MKVASSTRRAAARPMRSKCELGPALLLLLASCGKDAVEPSVTGGGEQAALAASVSLASAAQAGPTAYVSLAPGTIQHGATLSIVDLADGSAFTASLMDGGRDPVLVPAGEGDSLRIVATDSAGTSYAAVVAARARRPRVVRTVPAGHKTDVPLNIRIKVVFSEPVTLPSAVDGIQLFDGANTIAGTTVLVAGSATTIEFVPATDLAPATDYVLHIAGTVIDLDGSPMEQSQSVPFRTGDTVGDDPNDPGTPVGKASVAIRMTINDTNTTFVTGAQLSIDGGPGVTLSPGVRVFEVEAGVHVFTVTDLVRNCLAGRASEVLEIQAGVAVDLSFAIRCVSVGLRVDLVTELPGWYSPDLTFFPPAAFVRLLRGVAEVDSRLVRLNGSVLLGDQLAEGDYALVLSHRWFPNCIAPGPQVVSIPHEGVAEVSIYVDCRNSAP